MMPSEIGFCCDSIAPTLRNNTHIIDLLIELVDGKIKLHDIDNKLDVVIYKKAFYSTSSRHFCEQLGLLTRDSPMKVHQCSSLYHYHYGASRLEERRVASCRCVLSKLHLHTALQFRIT